MKSLCLSCNIFFESDDVLTKHIDRNHVRDIRKFCPKCTLRPNNSEDLKRHLVEDHNEEWRVPCHRNTYNQRPIRNVGHDQRANNNHPRRNFYDIDFPEITTSNRY